MRNKGILGCEIVNPVDVVNHRSHFSSSPLMMMILFLNERDKKLSICHGMLCPGTFLTRQGAGSGFSGCDTWLRLSNRANEPCTGCIRWDVKTFLIRCATGALHH